MLSTWTAICSTDSSDERVDPAGGRPHHVRVVRERRDRLLDPRAEIEALHGAARHHDAQARCRRRSRRVRARRAAPRLRTGDRSPAPAALEPRVSRVTRNAANGSRSSVDGRRRASASSSSGRLRCSTPEAVSIRERLRLELAQEQRRTRSATRRPIVSAPGGTPRARRATPGSPNGRRTAARRGGRPSSASLGNGSTSSSTSPRSPTYTSATPELDVATGFVGRCARSARRRHRSAGGVPTVVMRMTSKSAAYTFWPNTCWLSPRVAKIKPTSPRGIMPIPMSRRSPGAPIRPTTEHSLPMMAMTSSTAAIPNTAGRTNCATSASMPICRKKTGTSRWVIGVSSVRTRPAAGLRASAIPATNAPTIGASLAACASSETARVKASAIVDERSGRAAVAPYPREGLRHDAYAHERRDDDETHCDHDDPRDAQNGNRTLGDDAADDGEDHEPEDVVGHGGAEHRLGFHGGQGAQVAEDPRRDADTRRGERGADEHCLLARHAEREPRPGARDHWDRDTGERDEDRRPPHAAQLGDVHLEADFEQQEDHAELGERLQRLAVVHPAEHRRPHDHARGDLADDGRDVDAVGQLGRHLRREQHDENVEENPVDVHGATRRRAGDLAPRPEFEWSRYPKPLIEVISSPSGRIRRRRREMCTRILLGSSSPSRIRSRSSWSGTPRSNEETSSSASRWSVGERNTRWPPYVNSPNSSSNGTLGCWTDRAASALRRARTSTSSAGSRIQSARQLSSCGGGTPGSTSNKCG